MHRWFLGSLVLLLLSGCNRSDSRANRADTAGSNGSKRVRIAVIPKGTTHVFWKSVHAGAERAAAELRGKGIDVEIQWKGPLLENDREGQINVVQDFVAQRVNGIVLAPLDSTALIPAVLDARKAGIPTVIFDSALADEAAIVSYVATDNYHGGSLAAREIGTRLAGRIGAASSTSSWSNGNCSAAANDTDVSSSRAATAPQTMTCRPAIR